MPISTKTGAQDQQELVTFSALSVGVTVDFIDLASLRQPVTISSDRIRLDSRVRGTA